ncbi:uncharacterized protein LAESUDRAFT_413845 [Laetiporus sulphureus 93-53]|uniref:Uncharacterized protein n=1 Tax=Laetiporus sulphureus 93-53 TaxID=1314785 RepID=A0A165C7X3_9APHY|nr:uncharacterized protein LAESUDRAFT_413845 [Laetiporus sulphureus 93-53]KZT02356.1 hypothetical protein LAESUDRAFT_413845 [Laetiporus sulphureus 93-53]
MPSRFGIARRGIQSRLPPTPTNGPAKLASQPVTHSRLTHTTSLGHVPFHPDVCSSETLRICLQPRWVESFICWRWGWLVPGSGSAVYLLSGTFDAIEVSLPHEAAPPFLHSGTLTSLVCRTSEASLRPPLSSPALLSFGLGSCPTTAPLTALHSGV